MRAFPCMGGPKPRGMIVVAPPAGAFAALVALAALRFANPEM